MRMEKQKKHIRWGNFFMYLIICFPILLVVVWFGSLSMSKYFEVPVIPVAAVISVIACLYFSFQTDKEYSDEQEYYRVMGQQQSAKPKQKSVIGSAVVGSIIAGPVGGVIGAVHAADKNAQNRAAQDPSGMGTGYDTQPKQKSVIGSAVVGSIIAGPVGGVIGAVHAADKNAQNRSNG